MKQKKKKKKLEKEIREKKDINDRLIKDRRIGDIRALFEEEEEEEKKDYYKVERVSNFWNNNYSEYESNGDKNINLPLDEYLNKIEPYLRNKIIDLQNFGTWESQLIVGNNFISLKDTEKRV